MKGIERHTVMKTYANPPSHCDICHNIITTDFYDACIRAPRLIWANVCPPCFKHYGIGLGTGKGQHFHHDFSINKFVKVEG